MWNERTWFFPTTHAVRSRELQIAVVLNGQFFGLTRSGVEQ